jgi:hypothetical protein
MPAVPPQPRCEEPTIQICLFVTRQNLAGLLVFVFGSMEVCRAVSLRLKRESGPQLTPLLLVGEPLGQDQAKLNRGKRQISARQLGPKLSRQQQGICRGSDHEEQDTLDK